MQAAVDLRTGAAADGAHSARKLAVAAALEGHMVEHCMCALYGQECPVQCVLQGPAVCV